MRQKAAAFRAHSLHRAWLLLLFAFFPVRAYSDPVTNLAHTSVSSSSLSIQWDNQGTNAYQTALSTVGGFAILLASGTSQTDQNTTSYLGLEPNTSHTFLVKVSTDGDPSYLALSTHTWALSPGFSAAEVFTSSASAGLASNRNPGGTLYRLQASSDGFESVSFSSSGAGTTDGPAPTLFVLGLQPNTTYQLAALAVNFENLPSSRTVLLSSATRAAVPAGLSFSAVTPSSFNASWNPNGNPLTPPTSYQLQVSTDADFSVYTASETYETNASSASLSPNTTYYARAFAFQRLGGVGGLSAAASTVTLALSPGVGSFTVHFASISVQLFANGNPQGTVLRVLASTDGFASVAFSSAEAVNGPSAAPVLTLLGLQPNSTYQVAADALNFSAAPSTRTPVASTATLANAPQNVGFGTPGVQAASIAVNWDPNGNPLTPPTSYQVQVSTDAGFSVWTASETFATSMTSAALISNASYYFRVRSYGRGGDATDFTSAVATFTLASALTNFVSTMQTVSSLSLGWQSANSTFTRIEISSSTDDFQALVSTPVSFNDGFTGGSLTFESLRENTTYYFRTRARNENGLPTAFSAVFATRTASIPPEGISFLAADTVFATNDGEVRLTWTSPGGDEQAAGINVASYVVRYATFDISTAEFPLPTVSTFSQSWTPNSKGSVDARTLTGLNPGTTYFFAIKGVDAAGNTGMWSTGPAVNANRSYFAKDSPLSAPAGLETPLIFSSSVVLSWTAPPAPSNLDDRDAYRVYWATYSFSSASDAAVVQSTGTAHPVVTVTATGLENQTTYYFRVSALDKGDQGSGLFSHVLESALSAATMTLTADKIAPAAVSDLAAATGAQEGEVRLQWTAPGDDETQRGLPSGSLFEILYSSMGIISSANYGSPPSPSFSISLATQAVLGSAQGTSITGLAGDTTYWFAIKTRDESGNWAVWNSSADVASVNLLLSTVSQRDNVAPATVTGLSATAGYRSMALSWISPGDNGVTGDLSGTYTVKYGTADITTLAEFDGAASTLTFFATASPGAAVSTTAVNLANNATYYFAVRVMDDSGNLSSFSAGEVKNKYPVNQPPGAFAVTSPADNAVVTSVPQNVAWSASVDPDESGGDGAAYALQYSTRSDFAAETVTTESNGSLTSKNIAGALMEDTTTYVRIRARDNDGAERYSASVMLRINTANSTPSTFTLLTPADGSILSTLAPGLDWEDASDPDLGDGLTYTLKYSTNPTADGGSSVALIALSSYPLSGLSENTTYYWKALAVSTNPFTGTETVPSVSTYSFRTNSVEESPNAFSLLSPGADQRSTTLLPTFVWQEAADNDPGNSVSYTLTIQNSASGILFSTTIPNIALTTYTLTEALADNNAYVWSVQAKSSPDDLTRTGSPALGRLLKVDAVKQLPSVVTLSTPAHQTFVASTSPILQWSAVSDPDNENSVSSLDQVRYIVKIGEKSNYSDALGQQTFFSDGNGFLTQRQFALKDQTTYFWQVAAAGYQPIGLGGSYVSVDTGALAGCSTIVGGGADECYSVSAQFSFTVSLTNTPPSAAALNSPADGSVLSTTLPAFDWSDVVEADPGQTIDYILEISTTAAFTAVSSSFTGIASSSYTLATPLLQNRTYFWRVRSQDRFGDGRAAGSPVYSAQDFSFRVPVLTTPKEPTSVQGSLSSDSENFALSWSPVTQNTDGTTIQDLDGYLIYRAADSNGLGAGTPLVKVGSGTVTYTDSGIGGAAYFYVIRAVNTSFVSGDSSGTLSINSGAVKSSAERSVFIIPNDPDLAGKIEIVMPEAVGSALSKGNNAYGEDLKLNLTKSAASGVKNALFGVELAVRTAETDREIKNFSFAEPIRISFPLNGLPAPKFGAPRRAGSSSSQLTILWYNGVQWINVGAATSGSAVFTQSRNVGQFAVKESLSATEFGLVAITPDKIFTPNGDGCNDLISFQYQNPRDTSNIKGKVFDLYGAFVADLKDSSSFAGVSYDATCAAPALGTDTLVWDGKSTDGALAKKGIYVYQIEAEGKNHHGTIIIAR